MIRNDFSRIRIRIQVKVSAPTGSGCTTLTWPHPHRYPWSRNAHSAASFSLKKIPPEEQQKKR